ncbi:YitT family protein [Ectobacillus ponti]|uniref:YitT family protein n=1 Tax=Ectobacillus ponti TaxID=2961894 RepID=A0AA42BRW1_9BACI|nr:YitT family protein [Ectobacillus ponti]MCP8967768.1 YitT family protein [Ectobacillus ponti]
MLDKLVKFLSLNLGVILMAINIHVFLAPNHFAAGGLSGLTIVLSHLAPTLSIGLWMLLLNIVLFLIGFWILGPQFGLKTIYASFALSGMVWLLGKLYPLAGPLSHDKLIQLIVGLIISGMGLALILQQNASTGGMDLIAMILNKYFAIDIGKAMFMSDFIIVILSMLTLGVESGLYSLFGVMLRGLVIDYFVQQFTMTKQVVVISSHCEPIRDFIVTQLKRSATIHEAKGAYTNEKKDVLTIVLERQELLQLKTYIHQVDHNAFITVHNTNEVMGNGFN